MREVTIYESEDGSATIEIKPQYVRYDVESFDVAIELLTQLEELQ